MRLKNARPKTSADSIRFVLLGIDGGGSGADEKSGGQREHSYIGRVIRIAISQTAFDAIASTMPLGSVGFENKRAANGDVYVWLPADVIARLKAMRGPGGSYSDAIMRVVEELGAGR